MKFNFSFFGIIIMFIIISISALGQSITPETAHEIAINIYSELNPKKDVKSIEFSNEIIMKDDNNENAVYIFNETTDGFVILSSDKRAYPLLAYSLTGNMDIDNMPPALEEILDSYVKQIAFLKEKELKPSYDTQVFWKKLEKGEPLNLNTSKSSVSPLLATTWNQGCGYNAQCPVDAAGPCGRVYAGCVATAMGQVMRHHEHPVSGVGSKCYTTTNYGELCADFENAVYDYSSMPNNSANAEVAKFLYHCGVSVNMYYSPSGSGAYSQSVVTAMRNYFDYTNHLLLSKGSYSDDAWHRILKHELHNDRPMYYAGSGSGGHAFVIDGYQPTNHYHVNWGWGGSHNGYFYLTSLKPGGMDFTNSQRALVGVIPNSDFTGLDVSSSVELSCATPLSGDISTGTSYVNYYKNTWPAAVGKELVYHFTTTLPGRIRVKINNNAGGDVYTFLLSHPHQDSLMKYGTNGVIIDDTEPGTYWIAVEGVNGAEPTFDIEVICPTLDADLIIEYPFVSHQFIESELENVIVKSTIRNIGNTPAVECAIEYFISDDTNFDFGTDIFIDSDVVPALNPGEFVEIETVLTMPAGLTSGNKYLVFNVDRLEIVPESDNENLAFYGVQIPEPGLLDCSSAVTLEDGVWYYGNTTTDGVNVVEQYWPAWDMTGPEVVHSFIAPYSGTATISFTNKVPGNLVAMIFPICNENTYFASLWMNNVYDTITSQERYVTANIEYFVVVDGQFGAEGEYGLLIELPEECPELIIEHSGSLELCEGQSLPSLWTTYGYSNYMWYKESVLLPDITDSWFSPSAVGEYYVEVDINGCVGQSDPVLIQMDVQPDTAQIVSIGATEFCHGLSVDMEIVSSIPYDINWALNGQEIPGATSETYTATESGIYTLISTNGACSISSKNSIEVTANPLPVDVGDVLQIPSNEIKFYYTFENDNSDQSGNNYSFSCWEWFPANDRFDNFWQARDFTENDVRGYVTHYNFIPAEFTLNLWFKTSTTEGGLLTGFFNSPFNAVTQDAVLYMSDNGKLHFYLSNGGTPVELSSTESYNDGNWHSVTIMHDFGMLMDINNGDEFLEITTVVTKQNFQGYWTFGGINNLPANIANSPTSKYINAQVDDILCIYEGNPDIQNYNNTERLLDVQLITSTEVCDSESVYFEINPSEYNIEYKVWNNTAAEWYPDNETGTGESITIGGATPITETTEFLIYAVNNDTGCETLLSDLFIIEVFETETPDINIISDAPAVICDGTTINFTANITDGGSSPVIEWYVNGNLQAETSDLFSIEVNEDIEVYSIVYNDNPCATIPSATSNTISLNYTEILEAEVSIISNQPDEICEGVEITFNANTTNAGASPMFEWYVNGSVQTETTDEFSIIPTEDIEVYAVVISDYDCPLNPTETSNIIETNVIEVETPNINIISDAPAVICDGTTVNFTANITDGGSSPVIEWYVDGILQTGTSDIFSITITENIDVHAMVYNSNPCATVPNATSNIITINHTEILEAEVSIISNQPDEICEGVEVTFNANTTNAGISPAFEWYVNGTVQTETTDEFSIIPTEDIEVYAVVISDYDCPLNPTETSNIIETTVLPLADPIISISSDAPADICEGTEIIFTADVTNPGSSPTFEWYVNSSVQTETGATFTIEMNEDINVYAVVNTANPCASDPSATSDFIELTLAPSPDLDINQTIYRCFDETVTFHAPAGFDSYLWSDDTTIETLETSIPGIYNLTVTNEYGCEAVDNIEIVNYPDNSFTLPEDTLLCIGDVLTVSVSDIYESYEWEIGYGDEFSYQHEITVEFIGHNTMPINLTTTDENCEYSGEFWVEFETCSNVENDIFKTLSIYPNPTGDIIFIENQNIIVKITVFDLTGKEIINNQINDFTLNIDVSTWLPATYFFEITDDNNNIFRGKFIKH